jgi:hypothetical protein
VVIGPPLSGSRWVVGGGRCLPPSYHRTATLSVNGAFHAPERFAIDFVQLSADRRLFHGPLSDLRSYRYFGAEILSVADGVGPVGPRDDVPEQTPPTFPADATPRPLAATMRSSTSGMDTLRSTPICSRTASGFTSESTSGDDE